MPKFLSTTGARHAGATLNTALPIAPYGRAWWHARKFKGAAQTMAAATKNATNRMKIAVVPGDGIGNEVVPEGIRVLEAIGRRFDLGYSWDTFDWSCQRFAKTGAMMPADGLEQIAKHDAIYLGAGG